MNEVEFRNWMAKKGVNQSVIKDNISRVKKVERDLNYMDIDEEYRKDKCEKLLSLFENRGINDQMKKYTPNKLPLGKKYMGTYKYAVKQYYLFCEEK